MARFIAGKLPRNSKTVSKSREIRPLLEREALNVEHKICGKVSICLPLTLLPRTLFCHFISSNVFFRTSLRKRFELTQIFKALTTGYDVGFNV